MPGKYYATSDQRADIEIPRTDSSFKTNNDLFFVLFLALIAVANLYLVIRILKLEASISRFVHHVPSEPEQKPNGKLPRNRTPTEQTPLLSLP